MKTSIQLSRDDLPNKLLMLNDDFRKYLPGQIVALISTIGRVVQSIAIVTSSILSEIPIGAQRQSAEIIVLYSMCA